MSSLRVLAVGDNTNVLLYAWRIQQSKSVSLVHVSSTKSAEICMETTQYGNETFRFEHHYQSIDDMLAGSGGSSRIFDLVILSASSLQDISSLAAKLNPVLNLNTKILVESSGFVHLEPFVKMSIEFGQLKVFSVMCDFDIRQVSEGRFVQAAHHKGASNVYLGESGVKGATKYPADNVALLETFKRLFLKLFPRDKVHVCNFSYLEFLSQQWKLALPRICFDPLFILLENSQPAHLNEQILAKPLISGLVTEIITVTKTMGAKLPAGFDNEKDLLSLWLKNTNNELPQLAYHFLHKTAPLNIDMLLLQPILLADDYGIKTPYLEFLYSMMCQYQKINDGESQWFGRLDSQAKLVEKVGILEQEHRTISAQLRSTRETLVTAKENYASQLRATSEQELKYKAEITNLQGRLAKLNNDMANEQRKVAALESGHKRQLEQQQQQNQKERLHLQQLQQQSQQQQLQQADDAQARTTPRESFHYTSTGTPNLRDIEDIALYGVQYDASPSQQKKQMSNEALATNSANGSVNGDTNASGPVNTDAKDIAAGANGAVLRERELELRRRELELKEKELELQKRAAARARPTPTKYYSGPSLSQQNGSVSGPNGQMPRKPSYMGRSNRQMHGASHVGSTNMKDPLGNQSFNGSHPALPSQLGPAMGTQMGPPGQHQTHQFKTTSRKNRRSNMPNLRHASSMDVLSMSGTGAAPPGAPQPNGAPQPIVVNNVSTNSMMGNVAPPTTMSSRYQNGSGLQINFPPNASQLGPKSAATQLTDPVSGVSPQQRQISSSTIIGEPSVPQPNISSHTVVHNPVPQHGSSPHSSTSSLSNESTSAMSPHNNMNASEPSPVSDPENGGQYKETEAAHEQEFDLSATESGKKKSKFGLFSKKKNKA
ncbi:LADA_0D05908g1_1 [Lachancea dasiensis]|uniref:LADA_0D05908g1_1 n=1 Tax=Lachancea dasiensis TaxID=1072105 RepID=A0A1G4J5N5_9SACH|nr:LADA_0D05908g1_1 [Lachancea dasiensis]